jgi:hypothetical protein
MPKLFMKIKEDRYGQKEILLKVAPEYWVSIRKRRHRSTGEPLTLIRLLYTRRREDEGVDWVEHDAMWAPLDFLSELASALREVIVS